MVFILMIFLKGPPPPVSNSGPTYLFFTISGLSDSKNLKNWYFKLVFYCLFTELSAQGRDNDRRSRARARALALVPAAPAHVPVSVVMPRPKWPRDLQIHLGVEIMKDGYLVGTTQGTSIYPIFRDGKPVKAHESGSPIKPITLLQWVKLIQGVAPTILMYPGETGIPKYPQN